MDIDKPKKMTKTWKDRIWGGTVAFVLVLIPVFLSFKLMVNYNEDQLFLNKLDSLEKNKMSIVDFKVEKKEIIDYVDKSDDKLKAELDSKLDLLIENQVTTINLLQNINKNTK
jgi:hypothetical protein